MAITKIFSIKNRLDKRIAYVLDQSKTTGTLAHTENEDETKTVSNNNYNGDNSTKDVVGHVIADSEASQNKLAKQIAYALDREKTESVLFESTINCYSPETAFAEMRQTQERFSKTNGRLGYHIIQSFAPGEVSAEEAHAVGVAFAQRCVGEQYEVVIGTHLNKAHFHNHIVFNAVSFRDGRKYHLDNNGYNRLRELSDTICREHGLSVIEHPQDKGKHYAQWQAEQKGKPTIRSQIRADIDSIISQSLDFHTFMMLLKKKGYLIKYGKVKHMAIKPPFGQKYIRLDSLGEDYTIQAIEERLQKQEHWQKPNAYQISSLKDARQNVNQNAHQKANEDIRSTHLPSKRYYKMSAYQRGKNSRRKITGFAALYLRYVYLLRNHRQGKVRPKTSRYLLEDALHFDQLVKQSRFLLTHQIENMTDLLNVQTQLEQQIAELNEHRKPLYKAKKLAESEDEKEKIAQQITKDTAMLRNCRQQLKLCQTIQKEVDQKTQHIQDALQSETKPKALQSEKQAKEDEKYPRKEVRLCRKAKQQIK